MVFEVYVHKWSIFAGAMHWGLNFLGLHGEKDFYVEWSQDSCLHSVPESDCNRSRPHSPDERVYVGIVRESKEYIIKIAKSIVSGQEYGVASFNCQDVAHKILVALGLGDKGPTRNWFALLLPFVSSSSAPMVTGNNTY